MPGDKGPMALTAELVARVERIEPDPGPRPGVVFHTEEDYDAVVAALLAQHRPDPLWVFAYGSLISKPEFEFVEHRRATAHGWHRSFCIGLTRWRGTPEQPGLMMGLDRGGCCHGVAYRLPDEGHAGQIGRLVRREMSAKPPTTMARWIGIEIEMEDGPMRALAFTVSRKGIAYKGRLPPAQVAHTLARAAGHWGSGATYLFQTVTRLEEFGIRDSYLWHLQQLVADEIRAMTQSADGRAVG